MKEIKYKNGEVEIIYKPNIPYSDKRPKFVLRFNDDNQKERVHKAAKDKNLSINKMMIEALERYLNSVEEPRKAQTYSEVHNGYQPTASERRPNLPPKKL